MTTPMTPFKPSVTARRIASGITAINVLVAAGFAIAGVVDPASVLPTPFEPTPASAIFAMYAAARAIPLALLTLFVIYRQWAAGLMLLGGLAGAIQLLDAYVGLMQHDPQKIIGPLVIAAVQVFALQLLYKSGDGSRAAA